MFRKVFLPAVLAFSLITTPLASLADEGMWLPITIDKLPLDQLKKRGLQLKPEEIYSADKVSLKDAVVIIGGGTGTFVSPDGLIVTNHHVAFEAVTAASSTDGDSAIAQRRPAAAAAAAAPAMSPTMRSRVSRAGCMGRIFAVRAAARYSRRYAIALRELPSLRSSTYSPSAGLPVSWRPWSNPHPPTLAPRRATSSA